MSPIHYREALRGDLAAVTAVQHQAFTRVSTELHIPPQKLPPLNETVKDLQTLFDTGTRFFVATDAEEIVGSVRATTVCETVEVGRLVVASGHLRRGVATGLMETLEQAFPAAPRFELFTGADATAPLALYEKLGYTRDRVEHTDFVELVWLTKER